MTDNNVVEKLERLISAATDVHGAFLGINDRICNEVIEDIETFTSALELIKSQKAEIEQLRNREFCWQLLAYQFRKTDELRTNLFKLSGMDLEKLINCFAAGYTLVAPEPPKFNELAKFAEEMTEDKS